MRHCPKFNSNWILELYGFDFMDITVVLYFFLFLILANTMLYPDLIQAVFYAGDRFWARENRRRKKIKAQQLEELLNLVFSLILR